MTISSALITVSKSGVNVNTFELNLPNLGELLDQEMELEAAEDPDSDGMQYI